ncbi:carboxylesterase family protein [Actinomadura madurae]|uniref:carboxylesterase family protein n=1 Tax=Actinomadura madurae TaxID=1993 RepID=UPI0020261FE4|nr:carboxylesterase family protein [Actinomadura madurae]URN10807.1 carboxylesterase family protein [Actinomadura madurae]
MADAHAAHSESATFRYEFAWRSRALDGDLGATHAVELPFVFDLARLPRLRGAGNLLGPESPPAKLATRMHEAWIRFAGAGAPGWDPYDIERRTTMRIDDEWTQVDDPHGLERQAWSRPVAPASAHSFPGGRRNGP